jgi:hypothetical protein
VIAYYRKPYELFGFLSKVSNLIQIKIVKKKWKIIELLFLVTRPQDMLPLAPGTNNGVDAIVDADPDYIENYDEVLLKSTSQE